MNQSTFTDIGDNNNNNDTNISTSLQQSSDEGNSMSTIIKHKTNGTYSVKLSWDSQDLREGRNTIFVISLLDPKTNLEVRHIDYSFKVIYSSTKMIVKDVKNQKAPSGTGIQIVKFPSPGLVNISVSMTAPNQLHRVENGNINNKNITFISENVNFYLTIPSTAVPIYHTLKSQI